jgi:hypothetical protein
LCARRGTGTGDDAEAARAAEEIERAIARAAEGTAAADKRRRLV